MRVILTGERRSGKSTLCQRLAERLRREGFTVGGVWTETADAAGNALILHDLGSDQAFNFAGAVERQGGQRFGRHCYTPEGIYAGIKAIGRGVKADLLIVDEIGPLEMQWRGFFPILSLLPRAKHCLLVIRPDLVQEASKLLALDDAYQMAVVTPETRDERLDDLVERFGQSIAQGKWS